MLIVQLHPGLIDIIEPGEQRGFAQAVAPGDTDALAAGKGQVQPREEPPATDFHADVDQLGDAVAVRNLDQSASFHPFAQKLCLEMSGVAL